jgi:hypothetical protein
LFIKKAEEEERKMVNLRKIQKEIEREKAMRIESQELALQNSTMRETEDIDR